MTSTTTKYIGFRIPNDDYDIFSKKAKDANMSLTDFFKKAILNNKAVVIGKKAPMHKDKQRLLYLYNKTSNNFNQIAHKLNSDNQKGIVTESTYSSILNELVMIRLLLNEGIYRD